MNKPGVRRKGGVALLAGLLLLSAIFNLILFTQIRENAVTAHRTIGKAMSLIQSADSQLMGVIRMLEDGEGAAMSLYALGEVRSRLGEATGLLVGLRQEASRSVDETAYFALPETLRTFDSFLGNEVGLVWKEGDAEQAASRESLQVELQSLKKDLSELSNLSKDPVHDRYEISGFVEQWGSVMKRRIAEEPGTQVHQAVSWQYGM